MGVADGAADHVCRKPAACIRNGIDRPERQHPIGRHFRNVGINAHRQPLWFGCNAPARGDMQPLVVENGLAEIDGHMRVKLQAHVKRAPCEGYRGLEDAGRISHEFADLELGQVDRPFQQRGVARDAAAQDRGFDAELVDIHPCR